MAFVAPSGTVMTGTGSLAELKMSFSTNGGSNPFRQVKQKIVSLRHLPNKNNNKIMVVPTSITPVTPTTTTSTELTMSAAVGSGDADKKNFLSNIIPPKEELKKLVPLAVMFFCILFSYTILRDTKDVLMVTAPKSGAEVIPFVKTYCNLPIAIVSNF
jgi:TLC ATP/ADP transporter